MVERLTAADARILALEKGNVRGHTCKLLVLGGEATTGELRRLVESRIDSVPRLRQRLVAAPLGAAPPALAEDRDFSLARHVRDAGRAAGLHELRARSARLMTEQLDRDHPLWALDVMALDGGRTALVWRIHHAIADGTVAMRMARALLFDGAAKPAAVTPVAGEPSLIDALRWRASSLAGGAVSGVRAAASPATWVQAARFPATLRRELSRRAGPSPLDRPAGPRRALAFVEAPLECVKAIAHGAPERATVNDVVLAAVGGGLRRWLGEAGAERTAMRVKVPVSLHSLDEADGANVDSFMFVDLPMASGDATERLLAVAEETRERKRLHDAQTLAEFFADASHLSRSLERFAEHWAMSPHVFTLNVSNVPGPPGPQRIMGAPLLHLYSFAEIAHRHALRVAVVSAAGRLGFGLCADADAIPGVDTVATGIEEELSELTRTL